MKFRDLAELAWRNLREALLRNSLTTLGVGVGVASLVAMLSLGVGLQEMANQRISRSGLFDAIIVAPRTKFPRLWPRRVQDNGPEEAPAGSARRKRAQGAGAPSECGGGLSGDPFPHRDSLCRQSLLHRRCRRASIGANQRRLRWNEGKFLFRTQRRRNDSSNRIRATTLPANRFTDRQGHHPSLCRTPRTTGRTPEQPFR